MEWKRLLCYFGQNIVGNVSRIRSGVRSHCEHYVKVQKMYTLSMSHCAAKDDSVKQEN